MRSRRHQVLQCWWPAAWCPPAPARPAPLASIRVAACLLVWGLGTRCQHGAGGGGARAAQAAARTRARLRGLTGARARVRARCAPRRSATLACQTRRAMGSASSCTRPPPRACPSQCPSRTRIRCWWVGHVRARAGHTPARRTPRVHVVTLCGHHACTRATTGTRVRHHTRVCTTTRTRVASAHAPTATHAHHPAQARSAYETDLVEMCRRHNRHHHAHARATTCVRTTPRRRARRTRLTWRRCAAGTMWGFLPTAPWQAEV